MKIIIGLGNPGDDYTGTRHNVGFSVLDTWAHQHQATFTSRPKFKAEAAETTIDGEKLLLIKPTTFYNLVGESFQSVLTFYKLAAEDVLIIHDELSLPFGTLRSRQGGSDAGNNGIKSINQHGGGQAYRLRIGIMTPMRTTMGDTNFVLGQFSLDERAALESAILPKAHDYLNDFVAGTYSAATHRHSA